MKLRHYNVIQFLISCLIMLIVIKGQQLQAKEHQEDHKPDEIIIPEKMVEIQQIKTKTAQSGTINQTTVLYGRLTNDPDNVSFVRAPFPGIITAIEVDIGDQIKKGMVLAKVKSNQSLSTYTIKSHISGTITVRNASVGDLANQQMLFKIANFNTLWADLEVFPKQQNVIQTGEVVTLRANGQDIKSKIIDLLPENSNKPFVLARIKIDNDQLNWLPGLYVKALITIKKTPADIVIDNTAVQSINNKPSVFVKQDNNTYIPRTIKLGQQDLNQSEVRQGLQPGDQYVTENSYILKSDLEKSTASHGH